MIDGNHTRARLVLTALIALVGASSCAAPDAIPGPEDVLGAPAGEPVWGLGFGANVQDQHAFDVALDASTDTIVTTMGFFSTITIPGFDPFTSAVSRNVVVVKYAATGSKALWAAPIYASGEITRSVVDIDFKGNSVVAGGFNNTLDIPVPGESPLTATTAGSYDAYIVKIDPQGKPTWVLSFGDLGTAEEFVTDVATDGDGNIVIVGVAKGNQFSFGAADVAPPKVSDADIFVAKFDPGGKPLWAKRVGLAGSPIWQDPAVTVAVSRVDGSIIVAGSHAGTLDFPPQQLAKTGDADGFVVKLDPQGGGLWQRTFGTTGRSQRVTNVAYGSNGEVLLTGWFSGSVSLDGEVLESYEDTEDLLVAKLDANGKRVWSRGYGHAGKQAGNFVAFDARGQVVVVGSFAGVLELFGNDALVNGGIENPPSVTPINDVFAAKFSANGTPFWARAYGDNMAQSATGAVLWKDADGGDRAIIVGTNNGTLNLGEGIPSVVSQGAEDAFIMSITH